MQFNPFASSSKGNCYLVDDGCTRILVEAGIRFAEIKKHLNFRVAELAGVLITHEHLDHSLAVKDLLNRGLNCYLTKRTIEKLGLKSHYLKVIIPLQQFVIGTLTILPFTTQHDAVEPVGYLIYSHKTKDKLLFATDTYYIKYTFDGLTIIAIECNYADDILQRNFDNGSLPKAMRKRLIGSHFSLANVKEFLKANDLSKVKEIHLLHLSDGNSDEKRFKEEIQALTGKPVYVAG